MGADTRIEWAHHTYNRWIGCERLSPACDNCYAADWAARYGQAQLWQGQRRETSLQAQRQPHKWNAAAALAGERHRVFCGSLMDVFDNQVPAEWRADLFQTISSTSHLDWMLLTKRPQNIAKMLEAAVPPVDDLIPFGPAHAWPWPNVWLGTTIEDRKRLINLEHLRQVPAAVRFLSIEPLLEDLGELDLTGIHLVIVGGESGSNARPMHPQWVRNILRQCLAQGVAFFFKQFGEWLELEVARDILGDDDPRISDAQRRRGGRAELVVIGNDTFVRVGKKAAGRLLDGREHNDMPRAA